MSSFMIAFLVGISASVWIYSKLMRSTGGNTKSAVTAAALSGAAIFVLLLAILSLLL